MGTITIYTTATYRKGTVKIKAVFTDHCPCELYFCHPMTGQWCGDYEQILFGWSEQNDSSEDWMKLGEYIKDDMFLQYVYDSNGRKLFYSKQLGGWKITEVLSCIAWDNIIDNRK